MPDPVAPSAIALLGAIALVDRSRPENFTRSGRPTTDALNAVLETAEGGPYQPVTAAAADAAWESYPGRPAPDTERPSDTRFAEVLKLRPTEVELDDGYERGRDLVESVTDAGDAWVVITARGGKHRIAKRDV